MQNEKDLNALLPNFMFCWLCILVQFFLNNQLDAQFLFLYMFISIDTIESPDDEHLNAGNM